MRPLLAFLLGALLCWPAWAQQVPNPLSQTQTYPFPATTMWQEQTSITTNGPYPSNAQTAQGISAFAAKMVVPSDAIQQPNPNTAIAGWIVSSSTAADNTSTAFFGGSFTKADGVSPYGSTLTVCNCDGFGSLSNTGHNFKYMVGSEIDMQVLHKPGGVTPTGVAYGYNSISYNDAIPAGGAYAFYARHSGGAPIGFNYAFYSDDASGKDAGLYLGTRDKTGVGPSQGIVFKAREAGGDTLGRLDFAQGNNFTFTTHPSGVVTTTGHYASAAAAITISDCGTVPLVGTSNDTRGVVTVGVGTVTACTIHFGAPYSAIPTCVVSSASSALDMGISAIGTTGLVVGFSANAAETKFSYMCMQ